MKAAGRLLLPLVFLVITLFCGCKQQEIKNGLDPAIIEIKVNPRDTSPINLSQIAAEVRYVKLESPVDTYLGLAYTAKIIVWNQRIYISDKGNKIAFICCFDFTGKLLFKIMRKGKGPGEYNDISDYQINTKTGQIEILDGSTKRILRYDMNGTFTDEIKLSFSPNLFVINPDSTYLLRSTSSRILPGQPEESVIANLYHVSNDGKEILNSILPKHPEYDFSSEGQLFPMNEKIWFHCGYRDTLMQLNSNGGMLSGYHFNFGDADDRFFNRLKNINNDSERIDFVNTYSGMAGLSSVLASPDFIFVYYYFREKTDHLLHHFLYLSQKSHRFIQGSGKLVNDMDGVPLSWAPWGMTQGNEAVFIVLGDQLVEEANQNNSPEFRKIYEKIRPLSESDNPVLVFVKLKDF